MFKKPNKQFFVLRRVLLSVVATISVLIIVTASILFMLGYRLDSGNGRLEQGALLQFDSAPNGADVWIDSKALGSQTATKQTVLAGVHSVKITKNDYEDWNRTLSLEAGTLTWLDYIRMVPKVRNTETVAKYQKLSALKFSPDLKWALAHEDGALPTFQLVDLRSETVKSTPLVLPAALYTAPTNAAIASSFSLYRWNIEGRYAIVQHTHDTNQTEWLMVDTQDVSKSFNITRLLSVNFTDVQFSGTSGTSLYGLTSDGFVRKLDLSAATISRGLISNVSSFVVAEESDALSYVGFDPLDSTKKIAGIYKDGETGPTTIRTAKDSTLPLAITIGRYFSEDFVATAEGSDVIILTGNLPSASATEGSGLNSYATLKLAGNITSLSFSPKGDYLLGQSGAQFTSYEIEHNRSSVGAIAGVEGKIPTTLKWLDVAHLWNDDNNSLVMRDFDGTNAHTIMTVASGFDSSLSTNGKFFYAVGITESGYQLQRVRMIR